MSTNFLKFSWRVKFRTRDLWCSIGYRVALKRAGVNLAGSSTRPGLRRWYLRPDDEYEGITT